MAALDAPDQIRLVRAGDSTVGDEPVAGLLQPWQALLLGQLIAQHVGQRLEMAGVGAGVIFHARRERAFGPVGFLRSFFQDHAEIFVDEAAQAEFALAQQAAGQHGVEDPVRYEAVIFAQQPQVIVRPVQDQLVLFQLQPKRLQIQLRQRINQIIAVDRAHLDETKLFRVGVQTVRFSVQGQPVRRADGRQVLSQFQVRINHSP